MSSTKNTNVNEYYEKFKILYHLFVKDMKSKMNIECPLRKISNSDIHKFIMDFKKNYDNNNDYLIFKNNNIVIDYNNIIHKETTQRYIDVFKVLSKDTHAQLSLELKENPQKNIFTDLMKNNGFDIQNMMNILDDVGIDMKSLMGMLDKEKNEMHKKLKEIKNPLSLEGMMECIQMMKPMVEKTLQSFLSNQNLTEDQLGEKLENKLKENNTSIEKIIENLQNNPQIKNIINMVQDKDGNIDIQKMINSFGLNNQLGHVLGLDKDNDKLNKIMKGISEYIKHDPDNNENENKNEMGNILNMVKDIQKMIMPPQKKTIQEIQQEREKKKLEKQKKRLLERKKKQDKLKSNKN